MKTVFHNVKLTILFTRMLSRILISIATPVSGTIILFKIVENYEQCGQQNNGQYCVPLHCSKFFLPRNKTYLFHLHSSLNLGCNSINSGGKTKIIKRFIFLSYCILGINPCSFNILLLQSFLYFTLLYFLFFFTFLCKTFKLLCSKLRHNRMKVI